MSSNSDPITIPHQPGKLDFQIVEKEVNVTQFRWKGISRPGKRLFWRIQCMPGPMKVS